MRTSLSVRGVLILPLAVALLGAFACTGSPTQPDLIADTATGSRPRSFDESSPFSPSQVAQDEFAEPEFAEQELADEPELTEDVEEVDATDLGASNLDASDFEPRSLTGSTATAAATAGKVALTGVIKDKRTGRVIAGVKVNVTGVPSTTSNSKGYLINVPKGTRTLKFSKNGYATTSVTKTVTGAMKDQCLHDCYDRRGSVERCAQRQRRAGRHCGERNGDAEQCSTFRRSENLVIQHLARDGVRRIFDDNPGRKENRHVPGERQSSGHGGHQGDLQQRQQDCQLQSRGRASPASPASPAATTSDYSGCEIRLQPQSVPGGREYSWWCDRNVHLRCE